MKAKEIIEILEKLPPDQEVGGSLLTGEFPLSKKHIELMPEREILIEIVTLVLEIKESLERRKITLYETYDGQFPPSLHGDTKPAR